MYEELKRNNYDGLKRLHVSQVKINEMEQQMKEIIVSGK